MVRTAQADITKALTFEEGRRIAVNVSTLLELWGSEMRCDFAIGCKLLNLLVPAGGFEPPTY